jgi:hypothetical protein
MKKYVTDKVIAGRVKVGYDDKICQMDKKIDDLANQIEDLKIMIEDMERNITNQIEYIVGRY